VEKTVYQGRKTLKKYPAGLKAEEVATAPQHRQCYQGRNKCSDAPKGII
jgi:hypothetical protein